MGEEGKVSSLGNVINCGLSEIFNFLIDQWRWFWSVKTTWINLLLGGATTKTYIKRKISNIKECVDEKTTMILSVVILKGTLYTVNATFSLQRIILVSHWCAMIALFSAKPNCR